MLAETAWHDVGCLPQFRREPRPADVPSIAQPRREKGLRCRRDCVLHPRIGFTLLVQPLWWIDCVPTLWLACDPSRLGRCGSDSGREWEVHAESSNLPRVRYTCSSRCERWPFERS